MPFVRSLPLVAILHKEDIHHERCVAALRSLTDRLGTVWPVVSEAMHRMDASPMRQLMRRYRDLPMDLADAALVRVAERERIRRVFTIDRRDFTVYRPGRSGRFDIIP
jgi:predicted nucleic acid-binding protein